MTEILHFFVAEYSDTEKVSNGGGLVHKQEHIKVLELPFKQVCAMMTNGDIKDAKGL
ncbi:hypothetical protein [Gynuella sp.]|uniref:hypothetical protein n=1 Tax=Gynuella sp. TaxID=2969146 RepID=UPI003D132998